MAHILIADDDEVFRHMLADILTTMGHEVQLAADGFEAAQQFRARPSDVVMVDMIMPYGGLAAIRVLRDQSPTAKIIAMTGAGQHRLDYARGIGAVCTLSKPFSADDVAAAIAEALKDERP